MKNIEHHLSEPRSITKIAFPCITLAIDYFNGKAVDYFNGKRANFATDIICRKTILDQFFAFQADYTLHR